MHAKSFDGIRNFRHNTECGAVAACAGERRNKPLCGKTIVNVLSRSACQYSDYGKQNNYNRSTEIDFTESGVVVVRSESETRVILIEYLVDDVATPDSIIIPENVTEISSSVFSNRGNLVNVTLPSSLKKIGEYAFSCTGITSVELPEGLTEIGEYAFYCSQLIHNNDNITPKNAASSELRHATCIAPLYFFVRKKQKRNK